MAVSQLFESSLSERAMGSLPVQVNAEVGPGGLGLVAATDVGLPSRKAQRDAQRAPCGVQQGQCARLALAYCARREGAYYEGSWSSYSGEEPSVVPGCYQEAAAANRWAGYWQHVCRGLAGQDALVQQDELVAAPLDVFVHRRNQRSK